MSGGMPAGSSRSARLDPFALPVRFSASDAAADGRSRDIELTRERVVVRRAVGGMRMAVNLPVSAYRGISIEMVPATGEQPALAAVVLKHRDPGLDLPLCESSEFGEIVAQWHDWAKVLGVPLLAAEQDNRAAQPQIVERSNIVTGEPQLRRRRRNAIKGRKPSILMRRKITRLDAAPQIYSGEREIIARN